MKPTLTTLLLYLLITAGLKASFFWSAGMGLSLQGERASVLACARVIDGLYQTNSGERLINALKKQEITLTCPADEEITTERIVEILVEHADSSHQSAQILEEYAAYHVIETPHPELSFLKLHSNPEVVAPMLDRLQTIRRYPLGEKLFADMARCGNSVVLVHDKASINAGGYASADPSTSDIFRPGVGANARIRFRFDMPEHGTHLVSAVNGEMIPFSALDILFHELVHAKHIMCGTFSRGNSERQAIEEENLFRAEREENWPDRDWREYERDQQVWFGL